MSTIERDEPLHSERPVLARHDGTYGAGRYVWSVVAVRAGAKNPRPHLWTIRTDVCRRAAARHAAQQILDLLDIGGHHYIAATLIHTDRRDDHA